MDERLKFVAGLLDGEKMAVLCRKTGYKILERYNSYGLEGLTDRSRRNEKGTKEQADYNLTIMVGLLWDLGEGAAGAVRAAAFPRELLAKP
jgi:hypothetical protein